MIVLGRITAPFGIQGWVKVQAYGDEPVAWCAMPRWWLARDSALEDAQWRPVEVQKASVHGKGLVAKFQDIDDRDGAAALNGCLIGAPRRDLPANAEDEYYWADLIGLRVVNQAGESLGKVASLLESGANPVLCVSDGECERLLPFVAQVVNKVDVAHGLICVTWGTDW